MYDWLLTLILGRDIVNPRISDRGAIFHILYEPGQIIASAHETRRYHYLVESGEVDVVGGDGNGERLLSTLKVGDYFGHVTKPTPDCCIRARTRVRLLGIDLRAADALSAVRPDLALLLKGNVKNSSDAKAC
jgi:CRP-like cAMP-binding protein